MLITCSKILYCFIFSLDGAVTENMYSYSLNAEKRDDILRFFKYLNLIADAFRRHGFAVETFASIIGGSGVTHIVDIHEYKESNSSASIIAKVLSR